MLGMSDAAEYVERLKRFEPTAIYSSPYLRAVQTVAPCADAMSLRVEKIEEFREHRMAAEPISHWREVLLDQWSNFDAVPDGGESFTDTSERGWRVISDLAERHPNSTVLLAGHGTIISLVLHRLDPSVGLDFHLKMPNPAVYVLTCECGCWSWTR